MKEDEKKLNELLVDALNIWFKKEGLVVERPKRENTRSFKIGRTHRVKYRKVIFKHSRELRYSFKVGDIPVHVELKNWPPQEGALIFAFQRYVFKVIKLEPLSETVGYITVEDINDLRKEVK